MELTSSSSPGFGRNCLLFNHVYHLRREEGGGRREEGGGRRGGRGWEERGMEGVMGGGRVRQRWQRNKKKEERNTYYGL